jgi:uncharacterized protein YbcC (UPF0753/DUF2309 family)
MNNFEEVQLKVSEAAKFLAPLPPIYRFVASNPLEGLVDFPFSEALELSQQLFTSHNCGEEHCLPETLSDLIDDRHPKLGFLSRLNRKIVRYCGAYCDKTQAQWSMEKSGGLLHSWRKIVQHDLSLGKRWKLLLSEELPQGPADALSFLLHAIGVEEAEYTVYLRRHLFQLPGWASHLKWRESHGDDGVLTEYLAIRLFYELALSHTIVSKMYRVDERPWLQLGLFLNKNFDYCRHGHSANEQSAPDQGSPEAIYQSRLIHQIREAKIHGSSAQMDPDVQLTFCLDVREERFRRALESIGGHRYSTYGVAGFFGVPMRFLESGSHMERELCPIIIKPLQCVHEVSDSESLNSQQALTTFAIMLQKKLKSNLAGAFGFVDIAGPVYALSLFMKVFFPGLMKKANQRLHKRDSKAPLTHLDSTGFSLPERVSMAGNLLKSIGLTENFAKTVVFCGHESSSSNNPYSSALECGACGGNSGRYNARVLADMLNENDVREGLAGFGISIPKTTHFVGAVHNTATDSVKLFTGSAPATHKSAIEQLEADLALTGDVTREERTGLLPQTLLHAFSKPESRSCDPAQVMPELGLLGNRALVVGPRSLTSSLNLEGQVFLHSYEWRQDTDGKVLQSIVAGAVMVASGINMQYYTSAINNAAFGSGNKVTLNPFGGIGVTQGLRGDLKIGLTEQSVMVQDNVPQTTPMRLLLIIQSPLAVIEQALKANPDAAKLVKNEWVNLVVIAPESGEFLRADGLDCWKAV